MTSVAGDPPDLPFRSIEERDHMAAVGLVAGEWAYFEVVVDIAALSVAELDLERGACFTAQIVGHARKVDAYLAVVRHRGATRFNK